MGIVGEAVIETVGGAPQKKFVGIFRQVQYPRVGRRRQKTPPEPCHCGEGQPFEKPGRPLLSLWLKAHFVEWTPLQGEFV